MSQSLASHDSRKYTAPMKDKDIKWTYKKTHSGKVETGVMVKKDPHWHILISYLYVY